MTGFGSGSAESPLGRVSVELRSLNHRFMELMVHLPTALQFLDATARRRVGEAMARGRVTLQGRFEAGEAAPAGVVINQPLLAALVDESRRIRVQLAHEFFREQGATAEFIHAAPETLFLVPGVVQPAQDDQFSEQIRELFTAALEEALVALQRDREREGATTRAALAGFHETMRREHARIEAGRGAVVDAHREKLRARLAELLGPGAPPIDPGRLEQEIAVFADRADIAEECVRLGAHLDELGRILGGGSSGALGRRLDFLAQEIGREVNTIGSKCRDLELTRSVLVLKQELESLREQINNIE